MYVTSACANGAHEDGRSSARCAGYTIGGNQMGISRRITCECACHGDPIGLRCDPQLHDMSNPVTASLLHVGCHWEHCQCPCHMMKVAAKLRELRSRVGGA